SFSRDWSSDVCSSDLGLRSDAPASLVVSIASFDSAMTLLLVFGISFGYPARARRASAGRTWVAYHRSFVRRPGTPTRGDRSKNDAVARSGVSACVLAQQLEDLVVVELREVLVPSADRDVRLGHGQYLDRVRAARERRDRVLRRGRGCDDHA